MGKADARHGSLERQICPVPPAGVKWNQESFSIRGMTRRKTMMQKLTFTALVGLVGWLSAGQEASAQAYSLSNPTQNRPTVSPYLNLLQTNQFGISQYHSLVRPQLEQRDAAQRNSTQISQLQNQVQSLQAGAGRLRPTGRSGHATGQLFYSHYYNMRERFTRSP